MTGLLTGLCVLEREGAFGETCARFLASLGAAVTRVREDAALHRAVPGADVLMSPKGSRRPRSPNAARASSKRRSRPSERPDRERGITAASSSLPQWAACCAWSAIAIVPPVKEALDACVFHAEAAAAAGIFLAHCERTRSERGQHVDVSIQEVAASRLTNAVLL